MKYPSSHPTQVINGIGIGMLYFLLAVGLSIVFGLLRFVNFAHGAFYLIGAYFCYQMTRWGMSFWLALVVVPLVVGAIGWATEKLLLRHVYASAHEFHILVTVGLALAVQELVILQWGPLGDSVAVPDGVMLRVSQSDLAQAASASRQRVNQQLRHFQQQGLIRLGYRNIVLLRNAPKS